MRKILLPLLLVFMCTTILFAQASQWRRIGIEYLINGFPSKAVPFLKQASISAPVSAVMRAELAYAYQSMGDYDNALLEYTAAIGLPGAPLPDIKYNIATIHAQQGDWEQAVQYYNEVLAMEPTYPGATLNRAIAQVHLIKYSAAEKDYEDVLSRYPAHTQKIPIEEMLAILANLREFPVDTLDKTKYQEKQELEELLNNNREKLKTAPPSNKYLGN